MNQGRISEHWRLCDDFTVIQAALLIVGEDPSVNERQTEAYLAEQITNFTPAFAALRGAVTKGTLRAVIRYNARRPHDWVGREPDSDVYSRHKDAVTGKDIMVSRVPSWELTTVSWDDLKEWLASRGFTTGFFFSNKESIPGYLDPTHANYAPKLAAAVEAWEAINKSPERLRNATPKQALDNWLRANAERFQLTKEDGSFNEQGIEDIAKVANWKSGGAAKTPE